VQLGVPRGRIRTILNGIPLDRYVRSASRPLRADLGLASDEPLIGVVGRITPWKGQELFLRIAEQWIASGRAGRFVIIGRAFNEDAPFEQRLRRQIADGPLQGRVSMVPFQSDISAALSSLDVLLHTSLKPEPFGRVLIESMAVGTPVVAAGAGGVAAILTQEVDGLVVPPGDVPAYLSALRRLLDDRAGARLLAERARKTVQSRFSLDRVFGDFESLFAELPTNEGLRR
jgi:glycosyltransferase involved in cell wall biosynthesis